MRRPLNITLTTTDQTTLEGWVRSRTRPVRQVERGRIILGAAAGRADKDLAAELGCSRQRCARTRRRFQSGGLKALSRDAPRPGRPRRHDPSPNAVRKFGVGLYDFISQLTFVRDILDLARPASNRLSDGSRAGTVTSFGRCQRTHLLVEAVYQLTLLPRTQKVFC